MKREEGPLAITRFLGSAELFLGKNNVLVFPTDLCRKQNRANMVSLTANSDTVFDSSHE